LTGEIPTLAEPNLHLVDTRVAGLGEPSEKLRALNDYVKTQIRYVADEVALGAIVPRAPNLVLERKYGDCKDRALLVREMARVLGMEVYMVLAATTPTASFEQSVNFDLFNHVLCAWKDESGQWLFFDPTQRFYPFGSLPAMLAGKKVFIVGPEQGIWVTIPAVTPEPVLEIDIHGDTNFPANSHAVIYLRGDLRAAAAQAQETLNSADGIGFLASMIGTCLRNLTIQALRPMEGDDDEAVFGAIVDLSQFLRISPRKLYLPGTVFTLVDGGLLERRRDELAILYNAPSPLLLRLHLHHPGFLRQEHALAMGDPAWATFRAEIEGDGDLSTLTYRYDQNGRCFTGPTRSGLLDFCAEYLQHKSDMFVFPRSEP